MSYNYLVGYDNEEEGTESSDYLRAAGKSASSSKDKSARKKISKKYKQKSKKSK
jgi:hypothetical protein